MWACDTRLDSSYSKGDDGEDFNEWEGAERRLKSDERDKTGRFAALAHRVNHRRLIYNCENLSGFPVVVLGCCINL